MQMGDALKNDERSIRELVTFVDEELTDEKIEDRKKQVLRQIEAVRKAWVAAEKCKEKLENTGKGATTKDKRKYRKVRWESMRALVEVSRLIRKIEFTETIKRRMIDQIKDKVEAVMRLQRADRLPRTAADDEEPAAEAEGRGAQEPRQAAEGAEGPGQYHGRRSWRKSPSS